MSGRGEAAFPPFSGLPVGTGLAAPPAERDVTPDWKPEKRSRRGGKDKRRMRAAIEKRSGGTCEVRVSPNCRGGASDVHHRKLRSQGGDNTQENLLNVCDQCHGVIHSSPAKAYEYGWMVRSWEDPASVAVRQIDCPVCEDLGCEFCKAVLPKEAA